MKLLISDRLFSFKNCVNKILCQPINLNWTQLSPQLKVVRTWCCLSMCSWWWMPNLPSQPLEMYTAGIAYLGKQNFRCKQVAVPSKVAIVVYWEAIETIIVAAISWIFLFEIFTSRQVVSVITWWEMMSSWMNRSRFCRQNEGIINCYVHFVRIRPYK